MITSATSTFSSRLPTTPDMSFEPLFAVYSRACLPAAEDCLRAGQKSLRALLDRVKVRYVPPEELTGFDLERIFTNVNTPEEYERLKIVKTGGA